MARHSYFQPVRAIPLLAKYARFRYWLSRSLQSTREAL